MSLLPVQKCVIDVSVVCAANTSRYPQSSKSFPLKDACDSLVSVDVLDSKDAAHLALMKRPELGVTLTKVHAWSLTQVSDS